MFERQTRPVTDPGFGSYWTVNLEAPPGTKRPRKRGRTSGKDASEDGISTPKKRGRPRKNTEDLSISEVPSIATLPIIDDRSLRTCQISSVRTGGDQIEDEDEEMGSPDDDVDEVTDEDEYESEEDMVPPPHRSSMAGLAAFGLGHAPPTSTRLSRVTAFDNFERPDHSDSRLDRMESEMAGLRRQNQDTLSLSLSLNQQLSDTRAEISKTKLALEEEAKKRHEAERTAEEEARLRRTAEDALNRLRSQWPKSSQFPA